RLHAGRVPARQALDEVADNADGRGRIGEVGGNRRMAAIEAAGDRIEAIGLFRHRDRHDPDGRIDEEGEKFIAILDRRNALDDRTDKLRALTGAAAGDNRVEVILGAQIADDVERTQADADNAPVAELMRQRRIVVDRLVGAMEGTKPDMQDAGLEGYPVIG